MCLRPPLFMRQWLFSSTAASHLKMNKIFCSRCCCCCGGEEKSAGQLVGNSLLFFKEINGSRDQVVPLCVYL